MILDDNQTHKIKNEEIRVIGSLIEKENTTPEYYPMTINSIKNACNQKSNRNPVVSYSESQIENIISTLRDKKLASLLTGGDHRVPKYLQTFTNYYNLTKKETAVLCVLFLRGAQTLGEIRGRSARIYAFESLMDVQETVDALANREGIQFVTKLPKDSGREHRYMHTFSSEEEEIIAQPSSKSNDKDELEKRVEELELKLERVIKEFEEFKGSFE